MLFTAEYFCVEIIWRCRVIRELGTTAREGLVRGCCCEDVIKVCGGSLLGCCVVNYLWLS